jgi:FKBP-type peptidyl-prolyl cis-trans isomerase
MRKTVCTICLLLSAMVMYARAIQEEGELSGEKIKTGYAFGMMIGDDLKTSGLEMDYAAFTEGLRAAMGKSETRYTQEEAVAIVQAAFQAAMEKRGEENRAAEEAFLAENGARPEVLTTASGLQYEVLTEGDGEKPGPQDTVLVHYEGKLIDGTVFDSSYDQEQAEIPLDRVIQGWAEGIQLMGVGSKYKFYIPSNLAYGANGAGQVIPPYSTLIFTVELFGVMPPQENAAPAEDNDGVEEELSADDDNAIIFE